MAVMEEIRLEDLQPQEFIEQKVREISDAVGGGLAVNALSGGVDSSVVTLLGHRALGSRQKTYFIENGIMRRDEPARIAARFRELDVPVEIVDAKDDFFRALAGLVDP